MFLPIGDQPNPPGVPVVNYVLIGVNIAVYLLITFPLSTQRPDLNDPLLLEYLRNLRQILPPGITVSQVLQQVSAYDLVVYTYGYRPADPSVLALFTSMFLHGSLMHLAGNMLFLWIYGDNVEHHLGRFGYLFWYLATGAAATLFHGFFASGSPVPLVGASGAISGVLGFYFLWFPKNSVRVWVVLFPFFMDVIVVPARIVLGFYLLIDNLLPFVVASSAGGGVAHGAHIGGFITGVAAAWVMSRRSTLARPREFRAGPRPASGGSDVEDANSVSEAIRGGHYGRAAELYFEHPRQGQHELHARDTLKLAEWLSDNGRPRAALKILQRQLRDHPVGPEAAEAHAGAGLLQLYAEKDPVAAYQHLVQSLDLGVSPATERAVRKALDEIYAAQKFQVPRRRR